MAARVSGSWLGEPTEPVPLALFVEASDGSPASPSDREIARLPLADVPFVAAEAKGPAEFCSDDGSTSAALAVRCENEGRVERLVVRPAPDGKGLDAIVDGGAPQRWRPARFEGACFKLVHFGAPRDLEPLHAAWGRDVASARCRDAKPRAAVHVKVRFPVVANNFACMGGALTDAGPKSGPVDRSRVVLDLPSPSKPQDLGLLSEQCAGVHVTRYDDVDAVVISTSDMGTESRFAYRLGDRLYFSTAGGGLASAELPCGARVVFDFPASVVTEHKRMR